MQAWQLGSYELLRRLGEGGMAQVYLARDVRLGREVAIKVLDQRLAERPGFRERFLREARVAAALDHPNIVQLYDFGESEQLLYLVMPYVSGGSLQDILHRAPFPAGEVATYGSQMADALDYAHQRNVVHRDVKPANMLLHADGRVLLSDFGLAKIVNPTSRPAAPRGHPDAGTPEYMAPEQIEGRSDDRSDIYALGVVLYLLMTGHLPFTGSSSSLVMEGHLYRLPERPRALNPAVTPAMQAVVLRALAKHPDDRFQRANELGAALLGALIAGDAEPLSFPSQVSRPPTSLPPTSPRPSPGFGSGALGWEPPIISTVPRRSGASAVPLPRLQDAGAPRPATWQRSSGGEISRQFSGVSGAYPQAMSGPPISGVGRMPGSSRAPAPTSGPLVAPLGAQHSGVVGERMSAARLTHAPLPTPAPPPRASYIPMPLTSPASAQTRISVRSGMSQRVWIAVVIAIMVGMLAAGLLLHWLQDQPGLPAQGAWHGAPAPSVSARIQNVLTASSR
jgi:serine/threonine protein kinase